MGREWRALVVALLVADAAAIAVAFGLAYYLRFQSGLLPYASAFHPAPYLGLVALIIPSWLVIFALHQLYNRDYLLGGPQEYGRVVNACTYGLVAVMVFSFLDRTTAISRGWLLMAWVLSIGVVGLTRFTMRRIVYRMRRRGLFIVKALIVGANEQGLDIARQLHPAVHSGIEVVGFLDDYLPAGTRVGKHWQVLGEPLSVGTVARTMGAGEVIVVPQAVSWESIRYLVQTATAASSANGWETRLSPGFYDLLATGVRVKPRADVPLLSLDRARITGLDAVLKNVLDYGVAFALLVGLLPVVAFVALALKLRPPGTVIVRRAVAGQHGEPFYTLTFHEAGLPGPPSLAKLPALWNVLRGQMSLVGPRPILMEELPHYSRWVTNLLTVKPGLTGPWRMAEEALEQQVWADLFYIRHYSIWLDIQVLFKRAQALLAWLWIDLAARRPAIGRRVGGGAEPRARDAQAPDPTPGS